MTYLLDTTAFSDLMRGRKETDARLAQLSESDRVVICSIVRGEILYGISRLSEGKRKRELESASRRLFSAIHCEPVPPSASDFYAATKQDREQAGLRLDENDLWIAATALALGATLVTRDADFRRVTRLALDDWSR